MSFGENIRLYRTKKDMTQEELANGLSVSAQAISKWELDECLPDTALLPEIADVLEVSLDRLFEREQVSRDDIAYEVTKYLRKFSEKERTARTMELAYICELGRYDDPAHSDFHSVCIETEGGFSIGTNHPASPFFGFFPEPENGWRDILTPNEDCRRVFEILSDKETLETVFKLYERTKGFAFDEEYAKTEFGLENPASALEGIQGLRLLDCETVNINGRETRIWTFVPRCGLMALFILLHEYVYHSRRFMCSSNTRNTPYFAN